MQRSGPGRDGHSPLTANPTFSPCRAACIEAGHSCTLELPWHSFMSSRCSLCHRPPCATSVLCTLQAHLRGEHLPFSAVELDEVVSRTAGASRELGLVEREVAAYWTAEFFRQQRERDADQTWTALLLQWIRVVRQRRQRQGSGQPHGACRS